MGDPVYDFLDSGGKTAPVKPAPAPSKSAPSNDPTYDFLNSGGKNLKQEGPKQAPTPLPAPSTEPLPANTNTTQGPYDTGMMGAAGHLITGAAAQIVGGWRGLAALATGATAEDAANAATETAHKYTYQPEAGSPAAKIVDVLESPSDYNPLTAIQRAGKFAGEFAQDHLGASPGVATAIETGVNAVPLALGAKSTVQSAGKGALRLVKPTEPVPLPRVEPVLKSVPAVADIQPEPLPAQPSVRIADIVEPHPTRLATDFHDSVTLPERQMTIDPTAETWPPEPTMGTKGPLAATAPITKSAEAIEGTPQFLEGPPEAGDPVSNASRAKILQRIGLSEARSSALTGDAKAGATDFQVSKLNTPAGDYMRSVLDGEKAALQNHAESIVRDTGGTLGNTADTSVQLSRGNTITAPFENLNDYMNQKISALYKEADKRAGGAPVNLEETAKYIGGDQADFIGSEAGTALLRGLQARMKTLKIIDAEGNPLPVTIQQAEQLKQYLGAHWDPKTSRLIKGMKDAIDDDVLKNAGEDIYSAARQMRAAKAQIFENDWKDANGRTISNGLTKIFDANGKNIEFKANASAEKVANMITGLSADQLGIVVKTLKNLPEELAPQGQAALNEIKAQFANKILDTGSAHQGQWAARDVSKYLNNNAARLKQVFSSEELDKFNDLNDAGHILAKDQSYPGAAVQEHNLIQRGVMKSLPAAGAIAGEALMGGMGAGAGALAGGAIAAKAVANSALKSTQKRVVRLQDFPGINK